MYDVLIVGGGHAGAQAAIALRQNGFEGSICLVGEEGELPYERPPLSKDYFSGEKGQERIRIRPPEFWSEKSVKMVLGERIVCVDSEARTVTSGRGTSFAYAKLIWAAGGHAKQLNCDGGDLTGVYTLRTRADADRLRDHTERASRIVIIGGGYIGLEAAAVLSKLGKTSTVVESMDRVLARVAGEPLSRHYEQAHQAHGVAIKLGSGVSRMVEGLPGRVGGVQLADGEIIPADLVIPGIGIEPAIEPLKMAGAKCGNGVVVDEFCQTSLPDIYAIGDCAAHRNIFAQGAEIRLESVQNANDMAATAAKHIAGIEQPYRSLPWFWSNQYDLKLQTAGLSSGYDQLVVRGEMSENAYSVLYLRDGRLIALDCVNAMRDYVQGRKIVEVGGACDVSRLSDPSVALKDLARA